MGNSHNMMKAGGLSIALLGVFFIISQLNAQQTGGHEKKIIHLHLKAVKGLRYDVVRLKVEPRSLVKLTLTNADDMDHNLVFTKPGKRKKVLKLVSQLGAKGPEGHYIPGSSDVLWHILTVSPGDSQAITFTAPVKEGVYPFVCTYPGHGATMYGAMYVTYDQLPPLKHDPNVPHDSNNITAHQMHQAVKKQLHPYKIVAPYLLRTFMPDCSPAAIAVCLPDSLSYCWDAGSCRLRYAWTGRFLNKADLWQRKGDETAQIAGPLFFKDKTSYPFRVGHRDSMPHTKFKGYRLIDHYPEFHYQWNGMDVYELIKPKADGSGLNCTFHIPGAAVPVWFLRDHSGNAVISVSAGRWTGNLLELSPVEAKRFTITITKGKGGRR